jgi:hypothetical protein
MNEPMEAYRLPPESTGGVRWSSESSTEGIRSMESPRYNAVATPIWCRFERQAVCDARARALARAGSNIPARMAMMAITTRSSMSVKADLLTGLD